ncbi:zinc knuckle, partial [Ostertagia ostertagi]
MEQDGEVMAEICEVLGTDVLHVKKRIAALLKHGEREGGAQGSRGQPSVPVDERHTVQLQTVPSVGQRYGDTWVRSPSLGSTLPAGEVRDASVSQGVLTYLRSMACVDPGKFTDGKYEKVIGCEATLMEILGDDHLGGRAKSVFAALPRTTKEQGLDVVIGEMARLLSHESTAGRMRALTELRNLRMRPGQEVAEFCIVLENLGDGPIQTVRLRNGHSLSDWPEHFQLVGALHRVEPHKAYEEIKQLALSIEQSKIMFGVDRKSSGVRWKSRATHYRGRDYGGTAEETESPHDTVEYVREEETAIPRERGWQSEYQTASNIRSVPERQTQHTTPIQHGYEQGGTGDRKCYKCSRYGHIARNCPQPSIRVNHEIINQARSLGMRTKRESGNADELVGGRFVKELSMLGGSYPALIDTGSMISVVPVNILAKAQDKGVNVDALRLVENSQLTPVFDASNKRMAFLGAVYVEAELEGGNPGLVPFHISPSRNDEIILGTNALSKLGVKVSVLGNKEEDGRGHQSEKRTTVGRIYVPSRKVNRVSRQCERDAVKLKEFLEKAEEGLHTAESSHPLRRKEPWRDAEEDTRVEKVNYKLEIVSKNQREKLRLKIAERNHGCLKEKVFYRVELPRPGVK